ncbi:hypothetical protein GR183_00455 [Stappia sp. GBMRC 2046]|uniref:Glycosyltransferase RgtA/B/C/D-like domain-containing protein n=1 Tax=Stappia sediminis TaxID=2692190 RepID=A0A7X3S5P1_9HYPH|nr:glycosyltransferase family 39 protein [Stappia sediminis]MXN63360.1 hypothetical protein [Stappia sediminis]
MIEAISQSDEETPLFATPFGVWAIVAGWGLAHLLLRALSTPVLGTDDMFENVLVQTLEPGYMLRQPPLYEWLLWTVQQVFGPTIWSFLFLKYGLISLAALFLFLLARRAIPDPRIAALCVFAYSLFYQFGWNLHEGVTHTVVLTTACAASAYLWVCALEGRTLGRYVVLGVAFGAGMLAKHSYPLFGFALILAALSDGMWRVKIRIAGLALAVIAAGPTYSPYLYWILSEGPTFLANASQTMGIAGETSHLLRAGEGLGKLAFGLLGFSVPLLPVLLLVFWRRYLGLKTPGKGALNDVARLCGRTVLVMIILTALLIAVAGATYVKERHMHPLLILLPIYLFADLSRYSWKANWRYFGAAVKALVVVVFFARIPGLMAPDNFWCGGKCRHMKSYADLKAPLAELGAGNATLIANDDYTGGNLKVLFPGARVVTDGISVPTPARDKCFYVWEEGTKKPGLPAVERFVALGGHAPSGLKPLSARYMTGAWPHIWKNAGWRTTWWGVAELPPESPACQRSSQQVLLRG